MAIVAFLVVAAQGKEVRDAFSIEPPKGWTVNSSLSKLANGVNLIRADKGWTFSITHQPANIPSEAAAKKARTSPPDQKVNSVAPLVVSGQKGFIVDWSSYGKKRLYEAMIPATAGGYYSITMEFPATDSAAAGIDWNALVRGIDLKGGSASSRTPSTGKGSSQPAAGGAVDKTGFSIVLPDGWTENRSSQSSKDRAILNFSIPGAAAQFDIQEDNRPAMSVEELKPKSGNVRVVEARQISVSGRKGVIISTVTDGTRSSFYHIDNKRGGRYVINFSCVDADYKKVSPSLTKLMSAIKLK